MTDSFLTIKDRAEGLYKEKGSKFIAFAFPVNNREEIKVKLELLKSEFFDARHICYAWNLGPTGEHFRVNDDGEPSGSAGKPILGQINSFGLTNVLVAVIRYFGGTKLGVSGLIQAYKTSAADALNHSEIISITLTKPIKIICEYSLIDSVNRFIKENNLNILKQNYGLDIKTEIEVRLKDYEAILKKLNAIFGLKIELINNEF